MNILRHLGTNFTAIIGDRKREAENGLFSEDADVVAEDRAWPVEGSLMDDIPLPFDPYGCANPVSQEDGE